MRRQVRKNIAFARTVILIILILVFILLVLVTFLILGQLLHP